MSVLYLKVFDIRVPNAKATQECPELASPAVLLVSENWHFQLFSSTTSPWPCLSRTYAETRRRVPSAAFSRWFNDRPSCARAIAFFLVLAIACVPLDKFVNNQMYKEGRRMRRARPPIRDNVLALPIVSWLVMSRSSVESRRGSLFLFPVHHLLLLILLFLFIARLSFLCRF